MNYLRKAWKRWPKAEWIVGKGPYALVAECRYLTVSLWPSKDDAEKCNSRLFCGGRCWGPGRSPHKIVDLTQRAIQE